MRGWSPPKDPNNLRITQVRRPLALQLVANTEVRKAMIRVSELTKRYGTRAAISQLNFEIQKGEIVGFLGPNGAGKSTTMRILTGFMPGTAEVAGFDVFEEPLGVKQNVGFLPENPPVYPEMTISDYLDFAGALRGLRGSNLKKARSEVIEKTALGTEQARLIGNLSKGYRQRVGIAQALIHNPKVLILDEPTVGLDPAQIIEIRSLIKSLRGDHTVILSSHILPEVTATCERIIVISKGKIVAEDSIERLSARVNKGMSYTLVVRETPAAGVKALQALVGEKQLHQKGTQFSIEFGAQKESLLEQVVETAVAHKMGVREFTPEKVSLEEVFMELTTIEAKA
jgi:ABC-2 type transport system ATP-binding protein